MKKIFSILIAMFIVNIASMAQEQVFSIGTNGDIVTKTKFIEELYSGNYNNVTPYALKFSEKIDAASHIAINNDLTSINNDLTNISKKAANSPNANKTTTAIPLYTVNGLRYKGWDNDPGDFNVIEISYGKDTLFTLKYDDGWDNMSTDYGSYTSKFCGIEKLGNNTFSTPIVSCHIKRAHNHRTMRGRAAKGKSTMGWFCGFKLHIIINDRGEII